MQAAVKHLRPLPDALEEVENLFREHHDRVFRTAYRITGSVVDAEDVLQTIFLRAPPMKDLAFFLLAALWMRQKSGKN